MKTTQTTGAKIVVQHIETGAYVVNAEHGDVFALDGSYRCERVAGPFRSRFEAEVEAVNVALAAARTAKEVAACHDLVLALPWCNTRTTFLEQIKAAYRAAAAVAS